jgi:hypothetical protein
MKIGNDEIPIEVDISDMEEYEVNRRIIKEVVDYGKHSWSNEERHGKT